MAAPWEHGSDFPLTTSWSSGPSRLRLPEDASYWHSGRDALRALIRALAPKRVLFPSYYCEDVFDVAPRAQVRLYQDHPERSTVDLRPDDLETGDLVVVVNTFGLRARSPLTMSVPDSVVVVDDHTHAPFSSWAREEALKSSRRFAFASLRKWLPIPDGGVLWSPSGHDVPTAADADDRARSITLDRLSGMTLKSAYLAGAPIEKDAFRTLLVRGEEAIGRGERPSGMSAISRGLLDALPIDDFVERRRANHRAFLEAFRASPGVRVASAACDETPFGIVLVFEDDATRDAVRRALVAASIYPAVLWPLTADWSTLRSDRDAEVALSRRVLFLHCDHRYTSADMGRVAEVLGAACAEARS